MQALSGPQNDKINQDNQICRKIDNWYKKGYMADIDGHLEPNIEIAKQHFMNKPHADSSHHVKIVFKTDGAFPQRHVTELGHKFVNPRFAAANSRCQAAISAAETNANLIQSVNDRIQHAQIDKAKSMVTPPPVQSTQAPEQSSSPTLPRPCSIAPPVQSTKAPEQTSKQAPEQSAEQELQPEPSYPVLLNKFGCSLNKLSPAKVANALWLIDGSNKYGKTKANITKFEFTLWARKRNDIEVVKEVEKEMKKYQFS